MIMGFELLVKEEQNSKEKVEILFLNFMNGNF